MRTVHAECPWQGKTVMLHSVVAGRLSNRLQCLLNSLPRNRPECELAAHYPQMQRSWLQLSEQPKHHNRKLGRTKKETEIYKFRNSFSSAAVPSPRGWLGPPQRKPPCAQEVGPA